MHIQELGHVVLMVRDMKRSEDFYNGLLGLPIAARMDKPPMLFFTLGKHHDFAIAALGENAPGPARGAVGLNHVAFKVGDTLDELRDAKVHLEAAGIRVSPQDHGVTKSLYFSDPDGNGLEVFIDASDAWRDDPQKIASIGTLTI